MTLPPLDRALLGLCACPLRDVNLACHRVVTDAAKLVADDTELTALGRSERDDVLVSRMNLDVDIDRLQREAVLPVERREMNPIADALLQLQDWPPLPEP